MTETELCQRSGCPCAATHAVKLCAPGERDDNGREALLDLRLCANHLGMAKAEDFIATAPELLMVLGLSPENAPMAYIEGVPLTSQEFAAFQSLGHRGLN